MKTKVVQHVPRNQTWQPDNTNSIFENNVFLVYIKIDDQDNTTLTKLVPTYWPKSQSSWSCSWRCSCCCSCRCSCSWRCRCDGNNFTRRVNKSQRITSNRMFDHVPASRKIVWCWWRRSCCFRVIIMGLIRVVLITTYFKCAQCGSWPNNTNSLGLSYTS